MSERFTFEEGTMSDLKDIETSLECIEAKTRPLPPAVFHAETLIAKTRYGNVMLATLLFHDNGNRTAMFTPNPVETGKSSPVCMYSEDVDHLKRTVEMMVLVGTVAAAVHSR